MFCGTMSPSRSIGFIMSDKQQEAIRRILDGESIFLSGEAGCGKSWVIENIADDRTIIGAMNTVAARNVAGETVHSLFGLSFGFPTEEDKNKISRRCFDMFSDDYIKRIVLDEVSSLRADKLDEIDYKLRKVKEVDKPFGGIQMVFVGDLYQIPSVIHDSEKRLMCRKKYGRGHVFMAHSWKELNPVLVELTEPKRNENLDQMRLLSALRVKDEKEIKGKSLWQHAIDRANQWSIPEEKPSQMHLSCYKRDADKRNSFWYDKIKGTEYTYIGHLEGDYKQNHCRVPYELKLKVGTQVVLCANHKEKVYINGDRGVITKLGLNSIEVLLDNGFHVEVEKHTWEKQKYKRTMGGLSKTASGKYTQFPVRLGYSMTIHSAQGLTLDSITVDLGSGTFSPGMLYVALSRVRDLKNVALTRPIKYTDLKVDDRVKSYMLGFRE